MSASIPNDIPRLKDFNRSIPVEVQTTIGIVQLFPHKVTHGTGHAKYCVIIRGVCPSEVELLSQCFVYYKGIGHGGHFSNVKELKGQWQVSFETIIPVHEYWGEF